ncbi:glycosyltransferase [Leptothrix discophora]|uniref:Glycosyltransferase n=1 Tax=Leptothrix discophora TaxID=89 RepID=A0ABT9G0B6_LEPDI|nr:glycosyltransferase [Leptothrix discophora]MDP4299903.1 glycosyltransferase [Leptothrix discophora]
MNAPLRIAIVTPMLPVPFDQTRGRYIHETARSLGRLATVRTFFQTLRYPRLPGLTSRSFIYGEVGPDYTLDGCDVEHYAYPALPVLTRGLNGHLASWALTPRARRFQPDVMLGYWVYPDGYAALRTARQLDIPCVIGALGSDIHVRDGLNARMTRRAIEGADALVTVSEAMRGYAIAHYGAAPERVHTVVNGFNTAVFRPMDQATLRRKLGVKADEKLIVYVGRFVEAKGMRELVDAFTTLAQRDPRVCLALVGDGTMKAQLMDLVRATGLTDRVHLPGGLPPEQVAEWINAADTLTLPSWSEGYPNVVVEAVACGRPVVGTDVGGMREILDAHNGVLIPARDTAALTEALAGVLARQWDQQAIAARIRRTWDDVAADTLKVCEAVVAQRRAAVHA